VACGGAGNFCFDVHCRDLPGHFGRTSASCSDQQVDQHRREDNYRLSTEHKTEFGRSDRRIPQASSQRALETSVI
jgi:hypothetical protein